MSIIPRLYGCSYCECTCDGHNFPGVSHVIACCPHPHMQPIPGEDPKFIPRFRYAQDILEKLKKDGPE